MISRGTLSELLSLQDDRGAFLSMVNVLGSEAREDWNVFVTTLVLRELRALAAKHPDMASDLERPIQAALDFVETCEDSEGLFQFWPVGGSPSWAPALPPDTDDTALSLIELFEGGRRDERTVRRTLCTQVIPRGRLGRAASRPRPLWLLDDAIKTWLPPISEGLGRPNVVDCCVNIHALACMASVGLTGPEAWRSIPRMMRLALDQAGDSPVRARALTPFYPEPSELAFACELALSQGASHLSEVSQSLRRRSWMRGPQTDEPAICRDAYGRTVWTSRAVGLARMLARRPAPK